MKLIFVLYLFFLYSGGAMAIEEPMYSVISKNQSYEIRKYDSIIVAQTKVEANFEEAGNQAFRILADFIFGGNKSKTKIAMTAPVNQMPAAVSEKIEMTAPVSMSKSELGFLVQFTMPKQYTLETLPIPNDARVEIRQIPPRRVAVFTYSGSWSEERYQKKLQEFQLALKENSVNTKGSPLLARYNSPFQLWFLRRNEIWIEVVE